MTQLSTYTNVNYHQVQLAELPRKEEVQIKIPNNKQTNIHSPHTQGHK